MLHPWTWRHQCSNIDKDTRQDVELDSSEEDEEEENKEREKGGQDEGVLDYILGIIKGIK